ncbi:hypothetical protein ACFLQ4_02460, partial [Bacteroidota bacterium]
MKQFLILYWFLSVMCISVYAQIIHVPGDQPTIQAGIDAAQNGDTVLVDDGTYFENINFKGKAITVASWFLVNGDTSHRNNTIIDGSLPSHPDSGSVVTFNSGEDTNSVLCGFTITGGTGTFLPANPPLIPVPFRYGGGILCSMSGAYIKNNIIKNNECIINLTDADAAGGGICSAPPGYNSFVVIDSNQIVNNFVWAQGNITLGQGSWAQGGGVALYTDGLVVNNEILSNHCESIYGLGVGGGIRLLGGTTKILNNNIDLNSSISVNSGGTAGGISCSAANTIIDSNTITNNYISGALGCNGAGIYFDLYDNANWAVVKNNYISGNYHTNGICYGGAIGMWRSSPDIYNNIITNNAADYGGALNVFANSKPIIINNTITNNTANQEGGALYFEDPSTNPIIINSILWNNGSEIYPSNSIDVFVYYSDIEGGWIGTGTNNINVDPFFVDTLNSDFHLQDISLCIGAGIDSLEIDTTWYYSPATDFYGNVRPDTIDPYVDIGAIESEFIIVSVNENSIELPVKYSLQQNFPNPFNPTTTVRYEIPKLSFVTIKVYDVLGNEVATILNEEKPAGTYEITWNAANLPSGV